VFLERGMRQDNPLPRAYQTPRSVQAVVELEKRSALLSVQLDLPGQVESQGLILYCDFRDTARSLIFTL